MNPIKSHEEQDPTDKKKHESPQYNPTLDAVVSFKNGIIAGAVAGTLTSGIHLVGEGAPRAMEPLLDGLRGYSTPIAGAAGAMNGFAYAAPAQRPAQNILQNAAASLTGGAIGGVVANKTFGEDGIVPLLQGAGSLAAMSYSWWKNKKENLQKKDMLSRWNQKFAQQRGTEKELHWLLTWGNKGSKASIARCKFPGIDEPVHRERSMEPGVRQMFAFFTEKTSRLDLTKEGCIIPKDDHGKQTDKTISVDLDGDTAMAGTFHKRIRNQVLWDSIEKDAKMEVGSAVNLTWRKLDEKKFGITATDKKGKSSKTIEWQKHSFDKGKRGGIDTRNFLAKPLIPKTAEFAIDENGENVLVHFTDCPDKTFTRSREDFPSSVLRKILEGHNENIAGNARQPFDAKAVTDIPGIFGKGNLDEFRPENIQYEDNTVSPQRLEQGR